MLRDSLRQTMVTCGTLLWITFGATALIGVYNVMGGMSLRQEPDHRPAARAAARSYWS